MSGTGFLSYLITFLPSLHDFATLVAPTVAAPLTPNKI